MYHGNPINQQPAYQTGKAPNYNIAQNHNSYQTNKVVNVASINPNVHAGIKPVENKDFNRKQSLNDELFPQVPITTPAVPSSWLTQPYSYRGETSNSSDSNTVNFLIYIILLLASISTLNYHKYKNGNLVLVHFFFIIFYCSSHQNPAKMLLMMNQIRMHQWMNLKKTFLRILWTNIQDQTQTQINQLLSLFV